MRARRRSWILWLSLLAWTCPVAASITVKQWHGFADNGLWTDDNNWYFGAPSSTEGAGLSGPYAHGSRVINDMQSVVQVLLSNAGSFTVSSSSSILIGSVSSPSTNAIYNLSPDPQTFNFHENVGFYGSVSSPDPSLVVLNFNGATTTWNAKDTNTNIAATLSVPNELRAVTSGGKSLSFSGPITGEGTLNISGGETVSLGGNNSYEVSAEVSSSSNLRFTNAGGSFSGPVNLDSGSVTSVSKLIYEPGSASDSFAISGNISGYGGIHAKAGILTLSGVNGYNGQTLVDSGASLRGTLGGSSRSIVVYNGGGVRVNGSLVFTDASGELAAGTISLDSAAILSYQGGGTFTLGSQVAAVTPGSGGSLDVASGTLVLTNPSNHYSALSIAGADSVLRPQAPGALPACSLSLRVGGKLDLSTWTPAPTAQRELTALNRSAGVLRIAIDAAGNSTLLSFQTPADLSAGDLSFEIVSLAGTYEPEAHVYTIIENVLNPDLEATISLVAGGGASSSLIPELRHEGQNLCFVLKGAPTPAPSSPDPSLSSFFMGVRDVAASTSFMVSRIAHVRGSREDSTGSAGSGFSSFSFARNPFAAPRPLIDPLSVTMGGMERSARDNQGQFSSMKMGKTSVWAQPFGANVDQSTMAGVLGYRAGTGGILFGADRKITPDWLAGGGVGLADSSLNFSEKKGKMDVNDKFLTLFSHWDIQKFYVEAAVTAGRQKYRAERKASSNSLTALSKYRGYQWTPHVGAGVVGDLGKHKWEAQILADYTYCHQNSYTETGAGTASVAMRAHNSSLLRTEVRGKISTSHALEVGNWQTGASLGVVNKVPLSKGPLVSVTGQEFNFSQKTKTYLSGGVEVSFQTRKGWEAGLAYNAEVGAKYFGNEVFLSLRRRF